MNEETPETRKQRKGKLRPSPIVQWGIYDEMCVYPSIGPCYLSTASRWLRNRPIHFRRLIEIGSSCIYTMEENNRYSPELSLQGVYLTGAEKYGRDNYKEGVHTSLLADAAWRHINMYLHGHVENQEDNGEHHLAHALWQVITMVWMVRNNPSFNDCVIGEDK